MPLSGHPLQRKDPKSNQVVQRRKSQRKDVSSPSATRDSLHYKRLKRNLNFGRGNRRKVSQNSADFCQAVGALPPSAHLLDGPIHFGFGNFGARTGENGGRF